MRECPKTWSYCCQSCVILRLPSVVVMDAKLCCIFLTGHTHRKHSHSHKMVHKLTMQCNFASMIKNQLAYALMIIFVISTAEFRQSSKDAS